jgi:hypothetical protein
MSDRIHQLSVDYSERPSALLDAVLRSDMFDVRMVRLATGDYLINNEVLIERKAAGDFVASRWRSSTARCSVEGAEGEEPAAPTVSLTLV